jgi:predicted  nucleic acid-binding Zn-ribbon protein
MTRLMGEPLQDMAKALTTLSDKLGTVIGPSAGGARLRVNVKTAREDKSDIRRAIEELEQQQDMLETQQQDAQTETRMQQPNAGRHGMWSRIIAWVHPKV